MGYNATYTSVWDSGDVTITSPVLITTEYDSKNGQPYLYISEWGKRSIETDDMDITEDNVDDMVDILDEEYVEYDGRTYTAHNTDISSYDSICDIPDDYGNGFIFYD